MSPIAARYEDGLRDALLGCFCEPLLRQREILFDTHPRAVQAAEAKASLWMVLLGRLHEQFNCLCRVPVGLVQIPLPEFKPCLHLSGTCSSYKVVWLRFRWG